MGTGFRRLLRVVPFSLFFTHTFDTQLANKLFPPLLTLSLSWGTSVYVASSFQPQKSDWAKYIYKIKSNFKLEKRFC